LLIIELPFEGRLPTRKAVRGMDAAADTLRASGFQQRKLAARSGGNDFPTNASPARRRQYPCSAIPLADARSSSATNESPSAFSPVCTSDNASMRTLRQRGIDALATPANHPGENEDSPHAEQAEAGGNAAQYARR